MEGDATCRICHSGSTPEQPLFNPCKCSGSMRYVHQDCLSSWLTHSNKKYACSLLLLHKLHRTQSQTCTCAASRIYLSYSLRSVSSFCEVCRHAFQFEPIFANSMPTQLPLSEVLFSLASQTLVGMQGGLRILLAIALWTIVFPLGVKSIWRMYFEIMVWNEDNIAR